MVGVGPFTQTMKRCCGAPSAHVRSAVPGALPKYVRANPMCVIAPVFVTCVGGLSVALVGVTTTLATGVCVGTPVIAKVADGGEMSRNATRTLGEPCASCVSSAAICM